MCAIQENVHLRVTRKRFYFQRMDEKPENTGRVAE